MKKAFIYVTELGRILIAEEENKITNIELLPESEDIKIKFDYQMQETSLMKETVTQLIEYLEGSRKEFTIALNPKGTKFQNQVWEKLKEIPYGETVSYGQIACAIGKPGAARAVGMANHNNPILIMIPCHRVIGSDKKLVGYAAGLNIKERLLALENMGKERM